MPEGPQVKRLGKLIESFAGAPILRVYHPPGSKKHLHIDLPNRISSIDVKGKNIFITFTNGQILHNHMLMWGRWCEDCSPLCGKKRLSTCFEFDSGCLGYYGGGILRLVSQEEVEAIKERLGPDIIVAPNQQVAFERFVHSAQSLGEALLNQELISGVGNIYKSEAMFIARVHPLREVSALCPQELDVLYAFLHDQMTHDITSPGIITTTPELFAQGYRRYVYKRFHQPCLVCGIKIERIYQGQGKGRSTYFCPNCQSK